jgi:hypothetical protein
MASDARLLELGKEKRRSKDDRIQDSREIIETNY